MMTCAEFWTEERLNVFRRMTDVAMRATGIEVGIPAHTLWLEIVASVNQGKIAELAVSGHPPEEAG